MTTTSEAPKNAQAIFSEIIDSIDESKPEEAGFAMESVYHKRLYILLIPENDDDIAQYKSDLHMLVNARFGLIETVLSSQSFNELVVNLKHLDDWAKLRGINVWVEPRGIWNILRFWFVRVFGVVDVQPVS